MYLQEHQPDLQRGCWFHAESEAVILLFLQDTYILGRV
jgi:hypothetical protein